MLARELLNREDSFITATIGNKEYIIESYKRSKTEANYDDMSLYWTLNLRECGDGNIKR